MSSTFELTPGTLPGYLEQEAPKLGLDPAATLAVASEEGLGGGIGDRGTSFGPWQLHAGGALPAAEYQGPYSQQTQHWAWSPAGIEYALEQMAESARGLTGNAAVTAIVTEFERPADPSKEIAGAEAAYPRYASGAAGTTGAQTVGFNWFNPTDPGFPAIPGLGGGGGPFGGAVGGLEKDLTGALGQVLKPLEEGFLKALYRLALMAAGSLLLVVAAVLLVRALTGTSVVKEAGGAVALVEGRKLVRQRVASQQAGERRSEESHQAKLKLTQARTTELRTRQRHRAAQASTSKKQARRAEEAAYRRGAEDVLKEQASRAGKRRSDQ